MYVLLNKSFITLAGSALAHTLLPSLSSIRNGARPYLLASIAIVVGTRTRTLVVYLSFFLSFLLPFSLPFFTVTRLRG